MKQHVHSELDRKRILDAITASELPITVSFGKYKSSRSLEQNKLLWKWLDIIRMHIADAGGALFTAEELHEFFKAKFLPSRVVEINGEAIRCRATTTKLNTKEMSVYLESIDRHAANSLHLILPMNDILK